MQFPFVFSFLFAFFLLSGCVGEATITGTISDDPVSSSDMAGAEDSVLTTDEPVIAPATPATEEPIVEDQSNTAETEAQSQAVVAPRQYTAADVTDLVLITGQSNALGAETDFDSNLDAPHERVFAFTEQGWERADLHQVWDLGWFPRGNPGSEPSNNFSLHIGKGLVRRKDDRVFGFVLATAPGQGIHHWDTRGDFFTHISNKVHAAINQLPHKSSIDGIFWHQGESDEGDPEYGSKLSRLIEDFRSQNWYSDGKPFICGETAVHSVVNRQLISLNNDADPWTGCVHSDGLQTREDGFHFNAEGLRELGDRYAAKYLQLKP